MNIHIAAQYMKLGYRIRRPHWEPEEYVSECAGMMEKVEVHNDTYVLNEDSKTFKCLRTIGTGHFPWLKDLLADDWEIITTGIRKEFNKYGNFEYNDEPDWDNYVCKGWGDEDDE